MKQQLSSTILTALFLIFFLLPSSALALTAREIMDKVDARDDGDKMTADQEMILIDKKGHERVRKMKVFPALRRLS